MKMERLFRAMIGLGILAATVGVTGTLGGWSRPEPPADHAVPARPAAKAAAKADATKPSAETPRFDPAKFEPVRADQTVRPGNAAKTQAKPEPESKVEPKAEPKRDAKAEAKDDGARTAHDSHAPGVSASAEPSLSPDASLKLLRDGNARWVSASPQSPNASDTRRRTLADAGQTPFATVLTCADSRVPVELVFDRGVGDLFVVRVAGNVAGPHEAGTVEYGAEHLHVPLLVVMGHTKCGAVTAAVSRAKAGGNVSSLLDAIAPAVDRAEALNPAFRDNELLGAAVRENVWQSVFDLIRSSAVCRERIRAGELRVVGAVYDIGTGSVEWLGEHPWQREIIAAMDSRQSERHAEATPEESH